MYFWVRRVCFDENQKSLRIKSTNLSCFLASMLVEIETKQQQKIIQNVEVDGDSDD